MTNHKTSILFLRKKRSKHVFLTNDDFLNAIVAFLVFMLYVVMELEIPCMHDTVQAHE